MADDIAVVRSLIPDTDAVFGDGENEYIFEDSDIQNFLAVAKGNALRAAAYACMAVGSSEAIILKVIRTQDLQTNGATLQDSFTNKAKVLFAQADREDASAGSDFFQIIDYGEGWDLERPELTEWPVLGVGWP